jgi:N-glycosylase/DNA lyase
LRLNEPFDLAATLECGQVFRWDKVGHFFFITTHGAVIKVRQEGDSLQYESTEPARINDSFIRHYFRLDDDIEAIYKQIDRDGTMHAAIKKYRGLRLIRQEPFECLVSYICSANSNIPSIKRMLNNIAKMFGKKLELDGYESYAFPSYERINKACHGDFRECGLGFRAGHLAETLPEVPDFSALRKLPYKEAKKKLMELKGVGPKVADCVCLFSLDKLEAFPVDVWVERALRDYYFKKQKPTKQQLQDFAATYFGPYAGYAQEYLYLLRRTA